VAFVQAGKAKPFLKPIILDEILEEHKKHVKEMIRRESQKPISHARLYDKYKALITRTVRQGALHTGSIQFHIVIFYSYTFCKPRKNVFVNYLRVEIFVSIS